MSTQEVAFDDQFTTTAYGPRFFDPQAIDSTTGTEFTPKSFTIVDLDTELRVVKPVPITVVF